MKKINLGSGYTMDINTPTEEIKSMLKYFFTECASGTDCEWNLSKLLLQKKDCSPRDFIMIFNKFDTFGYSNEMNKKILDTSLKAWELLKIRSVSNNDLIAISFMRHLENISIEAWVNLKKRTLSAQDKTNIILYGNKSQADYVFNNLEVDMQKMNLHEACLLLRKTVSKKDLTEEQRVLFFNLLKNQNVIIKKFGKVILKYIPIQAKGSYPGDTLTEMTYCVITNKNTRLIAVTNN